MDEVSEQTAEEIVNEAANIAKTVGVKVTETVFDAFKNDNAESFDSVDVSELSEGARAMYYDAKDLDETIEIAKEDLLDTEKQIDKLEADIEDLTENLDTLENAKGPIFKDMAEPKIEDLVSDRTREASECIKLDLNATKDSIKSAKDAAKEAWKQYAEARNTYIKALAGGAGDAVVYFSHAALEKSANIFKGAVSALNNIKDTLLKKSEEAIRSMNKAIVGALDFATGGLATKAALENIEIAKNAKNTGLFGDPVENLAVLSTQMDNMCGKMFRVVSKNAEGFDELETFYQNIHDINWGEKGSPIERGEKAIKEFAEGAKESFRNLPDKITKHAEKAAIGAHDAALSVYAGTLGIAANLYSSEEKFSAWKEKAYNHIKANTKQDIKDKHTARGEVFDKIDKYQSIEKTKTSEYVKKNTEKTAVLDIIENVSPYAKDDPVLKTWKMALKGGDFIGEKVHYAVGDMVHTLSYTGKKVAGFAPNLARATEGEFLMASVQQNLKKIEKLDKKIEAEGKARESFKNTKEQLLGKIDEINKMKLGGKTPDKADDTAKDIDSGEERE